MERYIILDGNNFAHIAFHKAKSIILKDKIDAYVKQNFNGSISKRKLEKEAKSSINITEEDFNKISGFMLLLYFRKLHKFIKMFDGKFIIAWDTHKSTDYRKELFTDYKSGRDYKEDIWNVLFKSMDELKGVLKSYPIFQVEVENLEADDVIYKYSKALSKNNKVVILSSDSDLVQIAQEFKNIKIYHPIQDKYVTIPKDYSIVHYKSFMGDKSDDIPGVPGFGKKRALIAAKELASGSSINEVITSMTSKKKEDSIGDSIEIANRNIQLIDIKNNPNLKCVDVNVSSIDEATKTVDLKAIQSFYFKKKLLSLIEDFNSISYIFAK